MKSFAISALLGSSTMAMRTSSCISAGVEGVTCIPNSQLFATGMNGDEDLGQDIIMKGKPFHYNQQKDEPAKKPAGYEAVSDEPEKVHVLQTPNAGYRTTFYNAKKGQGVAMAQASPPGYETVSDEAEKVSVL